MNHDWTFGTVLGPSRSHDERHGELVMFIDWDPERRRMLGGGAEWFIGARIRPSRASPSRKVGAVGNYVASGWKVVKEEGDDSGR